MWGLRTGWRRLSHAYCSSSRCTYTNDHLIHSVLMRTKCMAATPPPYMEVSREVADAVAMQHPVVALETTILTHGLPYPDNISIAKEMEEIVRSNDVIPATIGVLEGKIYVGLSGDQLETLANLSRVGKTIKISRRDLAHAVSKGLSGGTTVASTMMCAEKTGVPIFITGGLGGVHRGGESTMDISADITELGQTPVAVVCAGIKSILDIGRTLEVLETQGVAVATLGKSPDFPAFFSRSSGHKAPLVVESVSEAAKLIDTSLRLGVGSGIVIAVPIPEDVSADGTLVESAIQQALNMAESEGVRGKETTPFVLNTVKELTEGKSMESNKDLLRHNCKVGSRIAVELAILRSHHHHRGRSTTTDIDDNKRHSFSSSSPGNRPRCDNARGSIEHNTMTTPTGYKPQNFRSGGKNFDQKSKKGSPVVIGASILDFVVKVTSPEIKSEGTNPGTMHRSFGGVARNIAECMSRSGTPPFFISALGDDESGRSIGCGLKEVGMSLEGVLKSQSVPTASYCVLLNSEGEMTCGVGDMAIHSYLTPEWVARYEERLITAPIVCVDGNIPLETLMYICDLCYKNGVPVWFEPTGPDKATALTQEGVLGKVTYTSPNLSELRNIRNTLLDKSNTSSDNPSPITDMTVDEKLAECRSLVPVILNHVPHVLASLGRDGVVWGHRGGGGRGGGGGGGGGGERLCHFSTFGCPGHNQPLNVSGAGDSFVGAMIGGLVRGLPYDLAIKAGLRAANYSVLSMTCISPSVRPHLFSETALLDWAPWKPHYISHSTSHGIST